jgi:hypothetical protein
MSWKNDREEWTEVKGVVIANSGNSSIRTKKILREKSNAPSSSREDGSYGSE